MAMFEENQRFKVPASMLLVGQTATVGVCDQSHRILLKMASFIVKITFRHNSKSPPSP